MVLRNNEIINQAMYGYVPNYYSDIRESRAIIDAKSVLLDRLNANINDVLAQFYVETATWGLAQWERLVDLPVAPTYSSWDALEQNGVEFDSVEGVSWNRLEKTYVPDMDSRRSAVKSKIRGYGTVTNGKLVEICGAYTGGTVEVHEYPAKFRVVIEFVDLVGLPPNIDTLQAVVRDIMPAHLLVEFAYRYLRWSEFDAKALTWDGLDAEAMTWDELAVATD
jgi:hypothetical protein